jgi:hypothetical protein
VTVISEFAPWPEREEDVTADKVIRHLTVHAFATARHAHALGAKAFNRNPESGVLDEYAAAVETMGGWFCAAFLLRTLTGFSAPVDMDAVDRDRVAKDLWRYLADAGPDMVEEVWDWVAEFADAEKLNAVLEAARDEAETAPKETAHA